jgi:hypothetical protein
LQLKGPFPILYTANMDEYFDYGMREFAIRDINGYILQFAQEIAVPKCGGAISLCGYISLQWKIARIMTECM